jgi:SAM-dependent methyltransferase
MENLGKADWDNPERVKRLAASYGQRYGEAFWRTLLKLTGPARRETVLDLGCGPGLFLVDAISRFKARRVVGLDASKAMVDQAHGFLAGKLDESNIVLRVVDFDSSDPGLDSGTIDMAFSGFLLHEIQNPERLLTQVCRSLRSHGVYAAYDYVSGDLPAFIDYMKKGGMSEADARQRYPHMCKYSLTQFKGMLNRAGFAITKSSLIDVRAVLVGLKGNK